MIRKTALFGGALMTAGIANAQFNYLDAGVGGAYPSFAQSVAYGGASDVAYRPDALDTFSYGYAAPTGGTTMSTTQTATQMIAEGSWDGGGYLGYGYGLAQFQQFFTVGSAVDLMVEWDVSGTDAYAFALIQETATGNTVFAFDPLLGGDPLTGSGTASVVPGVEYVFVGGLINSGAGPFIFSSTDTQFVSVTIPTPGVASVFGIAGLAATRRRR